LAPDKQKELLLDQAALLRDNASLADAELFPDQWRIGTEHCRLHYHFEPGHEADGLSLDCPLHLINQLDEGQLEWLVPGMVEEKIAALIGSLRKSQRRLLVPIKEYAKAAREALEQPSGSLLERLATVLSQFSGLTIGPQDFNLSKIPSHLLMRVRVIEEGGGVLGQGRDIAALKKQWGVKARDEFMAKQSSQWQRDGLTRHDLEPLPTQIETSGGHCAWPAWVAQGHKVGIRLFDAPNQADVAHLQGLLVLCKEALVDKVKYVRKNILLSHSAQIAWATQEPLPDLMDAVVDRLILSLIEANGGALIRDMPKLDDLIRNARSAFQQQFQQTIDVLDQVLVLWHRCLAGANELTYAAPKNAADILSQLQDLMYPGFVSDIDLDRLKRYPRYLQGIELRLKAIELDPKRDWDRVQQLAPFWERYLDHLGEGNWYTESCDRYRWAVEEYRIQLFAQALGTAEKVSPKRLEELWQAVQQDPTASGGI